MRAMALTGYDFKPEDELFLDANIWLPVYGPQNPRDTRVAIYSQVFKKILAAQSRIYIDVLIVSEFINSYARFKWNIMNKPCTDSKRFRKNVGFKPVARDIAADVKRVLNYCLRIENDFEALNIKGLIGEYAAGDSDFNDQVIAALCKRKGLKLITDDGDFSGQGIPVMTANRRLLA